MLLRKSSGQKKNKKGKRPKEAAQKGHIPKIERKKTDDIN